MDDLISIVLIIGILGVVGVFVYYVVKTYVMPRRIEELAELMKAGHLGPVIKKLQLMIEENDRDPYLHFLLAEAYFQQKDFARATMEYRQVIKIGKFSPKVREEAVRSKLAKIYMTNKNYDEAKKEFLILTRLDPTNGDNFYQVGYLFETAGLSDKALPYYKQAVKITRNHADAHYHIGMLEYNVNNIHEAKISLTEAVKLNPQMFQAHYYLGLCLKNQKDYDWAIKEFDIALKDDSIKGRAYLGKGLCLMEKEQLPLAIAELEKGIQVAQKGSELELNLRYAMGACAEKKRDFHTAISNWERIMDVNSKFRDVAQKLQMYEEFRTDDTIKDFMIASPAKFELQARAIVEGMNFKVVDLQVINDSEVHILCTEEEGNWRNTKKSHRLIYIYRTTDMIPERNVRQMHEDMRSKGANKGICMTTGEFSTQAQQFIQSRPIELMDRKQIISLLRAIS